MTLRLLSSPGSIRLAASARPSAAWKCRRTRLRLCTCPASPLETEAATAPDSDVADLSRTGSTRHCRNGSAAREDYYAEPERGVQNSARNGAGLTLSAHARSSLPVRRA